MERGKGKESRRLKRETDRHEQIKDKMMKGKQMEIARYIPC